MKMVNQNMTEEYTGVVLNYRSGSKFPRNRECLLKVLDVEPEKSSMFIGWKVSWPIENPRVFGVILKPHGRTGTLRVKFKKGLPGQALSTKVRIVKK